MRKKLPPYGRSVTDSDSVIWVFADFREENIYRFLRHHPTDSIGIFMPEDPEHYSWPVKGREVVVWCWIDPNDEYLERLALTLFRSGAESIYVYDINTNHQVNHKRS